MEKAYHTKCIELKRRLREIEEANEAATLRKIRLERGIAKLRITRAFLLEQVAKVQLNPDGVETDRSESPPPTVLYNQFPSSSGPPQDALQSSQQPLLQYQPQQPNHSNLTTGFNNPYLSSLDLLILGRYRGLNNLCGSLRRMGPSQPSNGFNS